MRNITGFCGYNEDLTLKRGKWEEIIKLMSEKQSGITSENNYIYLDSFCAFETPNSSVYSISKTLTGRTYWICFSGEIYNKSELKMRLKGEGADFKTETSEEILLEGFLRYGADYIHWVNGVFSFAVWDGETLYLFRDRAGYMPLFYTILNRRIIFASRIKAILRYPGVESSVSEQGISQILALGPAKLPGSGIFDGIEEIPPGCFGIYNKLGIKIHKYWDLTFKPHRDSYEDTIENTRILLAESVKLQTGFDVCAMLSGGLDSAAVTALSSGELKNYGETLNTFSFDFTGNDTYFTQNSFQPEQDKPWAKKMSAFSGTNHTFIECNTSQMADLLFDAVLAKDLPGMADIDSSLLYFFREIKNYNNIALSGECSDEIFGGYPWFHNEKMINAQTFPWSTDFSVRTRLLRSDVSDKINVEEFARNIYNQYIRQAQSFSSGETNPEFARIREIFYLTVKFFMATLTDRLERMSFYAGVTARAPFADYKLMDYVLNIPWEMKNKNGEVKHLLKQAVKGILPEEIINRKKSPYPKTYNPEYEKILLGKITEIMNDSSAPVFNLFDKTRVSEFFPEKKDYTVPWYGQLMSAVQYAAYILQINFWLKEYGVKIKI
ncbi:MAG: asparagine synthase (glutamine-hydrolyzing) [Clostridiales bacterium]|jgi:asparagine synthase (glutamine-hydrolysing)|nr:asparagine synthase (glutamine-hydrolyzing) [Clostridiales bacterium]